MSLNPIERVKLYYSILGVGKGLEVLEDMEYLFGVKEDVFNRDPYEHAYQAGQRAAVIKIRSIVSRDLKKLEGNKDAEDKKGREPK